MNVFVAFPGEKCCLCLVVCGKPHGIHMQKTWKHLPWAKNHFRKRWFPLLDCSHAVWSRHVRIHSWKIPSSYVQENTELTRKKRFKSCLSCLCGRVMLIHFKSSVWNFLGQDDWMSHQWIFADWAVKSDSYTCILCHLGAKSNCRSCCILTRVLCKS